MITTFYPPYNFGGDGIFVRLLANELAKREHQVEVIHCVDSYRLLAKQQPSAGYQDDPNVTVHRLESRFGFLSPLATQQTGFPLFKLRKLRQILSRQFDVIHYHNISLVGGPQILAAGRAIKLYTIHDYWLVCPTHLLFKFNRSPCTRRDCLACSLVYLRPPQYWRYFGLRDMMMKHIDRFISPSRFGMEINHRLGLDIPIVHLPHFVVPSETVSPAMECPLDPEVTSPYFLFVGRLEKIKGLQTLIPVFSKYRKARLLVAGQGNFEPQLRRLAEGSPNIGFLGHQSGRQLQALYRKAVAVIVPSVCFELFSLVILEAFREGTPVIANNIGGMPELIAKSGGGFIYGSEQELIAAMDRLSTDASVRDRLGAFGFQAFQQYWTPGVHVERYLNLIGEIAATRNQERN